MPPEPAASKTNRRDGVEAVNPVIADAFALFIKMRNDHWRMWDPHFRGYRLLFGGQRVSGAAEPVSA